MDRKTTLINLRPQLDINIDNSNHLETFQNEVLRPILKYQNDLILEYLNTHPQYIPQAAKINKQDPKSEEAVLAKFIKSNNGFRNKLYGMITAMMTVEEYRVYLKDSSEYNRRIVAMYIQRVLNQA